MMSFGVPAGTRTPTQLSPSISPWPASVMVGTSGRLGERVLLVTASARNLPALICGTAGVRALNPIWVWPATTAATAGPPPLNGTCTMSSPSDRRNCSPARCGGAPVPPEAKVYLPGLALTSAISSLTLLAGTDGLTVSTVVEDAASVTGAKSLIGSYGTQSNIVGLMAWEVNANSTVWPSGAAFAAWPVATLPVPPVMFSM